MIGVTVEADNSSTQYYGVAANELQENVVIKGNAISGKSKYKKGYTKFSGAPSDQNGNYLVLKFEPTEGAKVTTKVVGGSGKVTDCTTDKYCVYRLTNSQTQKIEVTVSKDENTNTTTYDLKGLTLEQAPEMGQV